ncbi:methyltransferase [Thiohalobacter thiocyanaticus]|uniref:Methyltransferase n=1 Tax=Thiohalobacter thiocyanaticus TaxID=585455 RepID=A0A1Z4VRN0_9GAMM|nr:methyltransferase [Thiohalobacter thiocyanaticus]
MNPPHESAVQFHDMHPPAEDLRAEVLHGLAQRPRRIPPKFFYDQRGSELFEAITDTPEYYPTRTELGLLEAHGEAMAELLGRGGVLLELGSGSSRKIRLLLDALRPALYMPLDISREFLLLSAGELARDYPAIRVHAACVDYSQGLALPALPEGLPRAAFFPGSSIGNFEPDQARQLLAHVTRALGPGGRLLIGVDLQKDPAILNAAYNDATGVTAAFNRNLLVRINRELGADFDLAHFHHRAFYAPGHGRVEMHLISDCLQQVRLDGQRFRFEAGEGIHTECSYKYSVEGFQTLAARAGFAPLAVWTDRDQLFSVHCLEVAA